jgi:ABC-type multidrug transport system fused ATPase/permease subunit
MSEGRRNLIIAIGVVALLVIIAFVVVATIFGWWPVVVDITLVVAALASLVLLSVLIYAVFSLTRTVLRIRDELIPTLESLKTTTATVRETARTASSFGVQPAVRTASAVLGAGEIASVILGRGQARSRSERRQRRRQELEREMVREEMEQSGLTLEEHNGHH